MGKQQVNIAFQYVNYYCINIDIGNETEITRVIQDDIKFGTKLGEK